VAYAPVSAFVRHGPHVYAGTGAEGIVRRSRDLRTWETFVQVDDVHVRALRIWANGLFMGTEPKGRIYVHNFSTGLFYHFVQTEDQAVSSFAEYDGRLYAGTRPRGVLYSFDGAVWREERKFYGQGIHTLLAHEGRLYVFLDSAETALCFDGSRWQILPLQRAAVPADRRQTGPSPALSAGPQAHTLASHRELPMEPSTEAAARLIDRSTLGSASLAVQEGSLSAADRLQLQPPRPEQAIVAAASDGARMVLLGARSGKIFAYENSALRSLYQSAETAGGPLVKLSAGIYLAALGRKLYLVED
jgi:hypothetical protein